MNNKRLLNHIPNKTAMRGFSILEFLVASLLSMIVLMAVSSTYFTARGLNKSANTRIGIQQYDCPRCAYGRQFRLLQYV